MSGHSKWAQIKHKKAVTDAKRGNLFSKLSRAITIAARDGSPDPQTNARLRVAVEKARSVNMPSDNIERAIAKADPAKSGTELFEVVYEAYAPGGSALLIEGITDNKNRTAAEIKHLLSERGGKLAEAGAVGWMFERKGIIELARTDNPKLGEPETELALIDAGAEEILSEEESVSLLVPEKRRLEIETALTQAGFSTRESYDAAVPKIRHPADADTKKSTEALIEALEEHDDVQFVWSTLET